MSSTAGISPNGAAEKLRRSAGLRMDRVLVETRTAPLVRTSTRPAPELTIVVPTFNERTNVPLLVVRLQRTLDGIDWEVIFVDDNSPDGTAAAVRALGESDARVRCIRRIGRRGLAGACLEGMLASQARFVAVMDADLQHDETLLGAMLARLRPGDVDLAVASRYVGAGTGRPARELQPLVDRAGAAAAARRAERPDERLLHAAPHRPRGAGAGP